MEKNRCTALPAAGQLATPPAESERERERERDTERERGKYSNTDLKQEDTGKIGFKKIHVTDSVL